jgi:hypothetical protein
MNSENQKLILDTKEIRIIDFLSSVGHRPVREGALYALFHAPYRADVHPSLKVNKKQNRWCDLSLMISGDIIDLGKLMYHTDNIWDTINRIHGHAPACPTMRTDLRLGKDCRSNTTFKNVTTMRLENRSLVSYLANRGIDLDIALRYCVEVHYKHNYRPYFALGFENISHGIEARNPYFKGCIGAKDITVIIQKEGNNKCNIYEGFMDFLSYLTLCKKERMVYDENADFIILNSVGLLRRAMSWLSQYPMINCYLDNDDAGHQTVEMLNEVHNGVIDMSNLYAGFKDLNDYLIGKRYCP